jgi:hypothetical protein
MGLRAGIPEDTTLLGKSATVVDVDEECPKEDHMSTNITGSTMRGTC